MGNGEDDDLTKRGVNASSGPREGVEAVRFPEGVAVKNVPLSNQSRSHQFDDNTLLVQL